MISVNRQTTPHLNRDGPPRRADHPLPERTGTLVTRGVVHGPVVVAVNLLRERIAEPWTLDALASEVHLSRPQVVRCFDATTGMSPMAYLRKMQRERGVRGDRQLGDVEPDDAGGRTADDDLPGEGLLDPVLRPEGSKYPRARLGGPDLAA